MVTSVATIRKVGSSLYVIFPVDLLKAWGARKGDRLAIRFDGSTVALTRIDFSSLPPIRSEVDDDDARSKKAGPVGR